MTNTHFTITGAEHFPIGARPNLSPSLPAGFYTIESCMQRGPFFRRIEPMSLPPKLYGDIEVRADRIKTTFAKRRAGTTGVMLSGEKGSGKTLLGRKLAIDCCEAGMPIIVLNKPLAGDALGGMLQTIGSPFVLFIDEFEKVYGKEHQEALLTVLDGVFTLHMLAILTTNDNTRLIDPLMNRPGRIFYRMHYAGLTPEFVREFGEDHLSDKGQIDNLVRLATLTSLNFDQMNALIEEMNRYGESLIEAVQFLNVDVEAGEVNYTIEEVEYEGKSYATRDITRYTISVDLMNGDPKEWSYVVLMRENTEGLNYEQLRLMPEVRHGDEYGRTWDLTRFNREIFHEFRLTGGKGGDKEEEAPPVPSHFPWGVRVVKDCTEAKVLPDGRIEAVFPTCEGKTIRLTLRRPWSSVERKRLL